MQPLLHFLAFPVFLYLLIGLNFVIVLCVFVPRFLSPDLLPPPLWARLAAAPLVLVAWPRYARRMVRSGEPGTGAPAEREEDADKEGSGGVRG